MMRIKFIMLVLTAVCAFSGVTASASVAATRCYLVAMPGTGNRTDSHCKNVGAGEFIKAKALVQKLAGGREWCAETFEANVGNFTNSACTTEGVGNFVKVIQLPFKWQVNAALLKQGSKQIKLQIKAPAVLKTPELKAEISCNSSISEGATIDGNGAGQGQGKGRVTYSSCTVLKPSECTVAEPITTRQLKAYLANAATQTEAVEVFVPTEGTLFVTLKFSGKGCGANLEGERGVSGSVAGEVIPAEAEGQEGLVAFPQTPITKVKYEEQEQKIGLNVVGFASTFTGAYGARLATNEAFGVFQN